MRLISRQDIEAPADQVFRLLTDFPAWERAARQRGAEVLREDPSGRFGAGTEWRVRFDWRGRRRDAVVRLDQAEPSSHLAFSFTSGMFEGTTSMEIIELAARRCRIRVLGEFRPRTLTARLMLQSLRLARGKVERRFDGRVAEMAAGIETRLKSHR